MATSLLSRAAAGSALQEGAALVRALQAAQAHFAKRRIAAAWQCLRPHTGRSVPPAAAGPLWEMCAHLAMSGCAPLDPRQAITRALHAYQQEHDVPGMARVHHALGEMLLGAGQLQEASREFGYAHQLCARAGSPVLRIGSLCRQAEAALLMHQSGALVDHLDAALQLCRVLAGSEWLEAEARLLAAQASFLAGQPQEAARQLLWAERLTQCAAPGAEVAGLDAMDVAVGANTLLAAQAMAMRRAEALYRMGHARRGLACLKAAGAYALPGPDGDGASGDAAGAVSVQERAHQWRLCGACLLLDQPAAALVALTQAEAAFARLRQPYHRTFCQIAIVRAAHRLGNMKQVRARLDELGALRLGAWPWLRQHFDEARLEVETPVVRVRGAVTAPWLQDLRMGPREPSEAAAALDAQRAPDAAAAGSGFFGKVQTAWDRLRTTVVARSSAS